MVIPETLKKYENFINSLPQSIQQRFDKSSDALLSQILNSKDGRLILKVKKDGHDFSFYMPKDEEIPNSFASSIWDNASIEDKIKIISKYMDYLFQNYEDKPVLRILPKSLEEKNLNCYASYNRHNNTIFVNLDMCSKSSGIEFMSYIFHECTHAKDMANINKNIFPEILSKYTKVNENEFDYENIREREIMNLESSGIIHNFESGEDEIINTSLQNKILKCLNVYSVFNEIKSVDTRKVKDKKDFEEYMNTIMYCYSPLERFARISVRNFFKTQLTDGSVLESKDIKIAQKIIRSEEDMDRVIGEFKDILVEKTPDGNTNSIIDMKDLFELVAKHKFYTRPAIGVSNANKYPKESEEIENKYNQIIGRIYSNFILQKQSKEKEM